jgi:hypothetical protein
MLPTESATKTRQGVPHRLGPRDVGTEEVAPHHVRVCATEEGDALSAVAGDDVALGAGGSADHVVGRREDVDPFAAVLERDGAGRIHPDEVALDRVDGR